MKQEAKQKKPLWTEKCLLFLPRVSSVSLQPILSSLICRIFFRHGYGDVHRIFLELQMSTVVVAFRRQSVVQRRRRRRRRVFVVRPRRQERVTFEVAKFWDLEAVAEPRRGRNTFWSKQASFVGWRFRTWNSSNQRGQRESKVNIYHGALYLKEMKAISA